MAELGAARQRLAADTVKSLPKGRAALYTGRARFDREGHVTETFLRLETAIPPETDGPAPDRLIEGAPVFTTWNVEERDGLYCGTWRSTAGKWRIHYDEWEYCRILEGHSILTGDDGTVHEVRAGDSFILRPGFTGTWEVVETTTKEYVIRL